MAHRQDPARSARRRSMRGQRRCRGASAPARGGAARAAYAAIRAAAGQELEERHHAEPRRDHEHEDREGHGGEDVDGEIAPELLQAAPAPAALDPGRLGLCDPWRRGRARRAGAGRPGCARAVRRGRAAHSPSASVASQTAPVSCMKRSPNRMSSGAPAAPLADEQSVAEHGDGERDDRDLAPRHRRRGRDRERPQAVGAERHRGRHREHQSRGTRPCTGRAPRASGAPPDRGSRRSACPRRRTAPRTTQRPRTSASSGRARRDRRPAPAAGRRRRPRRCPRSRSAAARTV